MRIPDGDLVPARRRPYGGGYSRRRRPLRRLAFVLALVLLASGAAWFFQRDDGAARTRATGCVGAPTPTASAGSTLPEPREVRLVLLNGTGRTGLAKQVGALLKARGFVVLSEDNATAALAGSSVVTYGPGSEAGAAVLGGQVPGARLVSAPSARAGTLQLVLGGDYRRLATPAEVTVAALAAAPSVVPTPTQTPCAP